MLPKKNRLKKREDFSIVFSKGKFATFNGISIKYLLNNQSDSRIGFPVGKNFSKKAAVRNRARRILRAATYQLIPNLKSGFDIVVLINPKMSDVKFASIKEQLYNLFFKANLLK